MAIRASIHQKVLALALCWLSLPMSARAEEIRDVALIPPPRRNMAGGFFESQLFINRHSPTWDIPLATMGVERTRSMRVDGTLADISALFLIPQLNTLLSNDQNCQESLREEIMRGARSEVTAALSGSVGVPAQKDAYVRGLRSVVRSLANILFSQAGITDSGRIRQWADRIMRPFEECLERGGDSNIGGVGICVAQQGLDYPTLIANVGLAVTRESWQRLQPAAVAGHDRAYRSCVAAAQPGGSLGCLADQLVQSAPLQAERAIPANTQLSGEAQAEYQASMGRFPSCVGNGAERFQRVMGCSRTFRNEIASLVSTQMLASVLHGRITSRDEAAMVERFTAQDGSFVRCLQPATSERCTIGSFAENRTERCQVALLQEVGVPAGEALFTHQYDQFMSRPPNVDSSGRHASVRARLVGPRGSVTLEHAQCLGRVRAQNSSTRAMDELEACFASSVVLLARGIGDIQFNDTVPGLLGERQAGDDSLATLRREFRRQLRGCLESRITGATLMASETHANACAELVQDRLTPLVAENVLAHNLASAIPNPGDEEGDREATALRESLQNRLMGWLRACLSARGADSQRCTDEMQPAAHLLIARAAADAQMEGRLRLTREQLTPAQREELAGHDRRLRGCLYPSSDVPESFRGAADGVGEPIRAENATAQDPSNCDRDYAVGMARSLGTIALNRILRPPVISDEERTAQAGRIALLTTHYGECLDRARSLPALQDTMSAAGRCGTTLESEGSAFASTLIEERMLSHASENGPQAQAARALLAKLLPCLVTSVNTAGGDAIGSSGGTSVLSMAGDVSGDYIDYDPAEALRQIEGVTREFIRAMGDSPIAASCDLAGLRTMVASTQSGCSQPMGGTIRLPDVPGLTTHQMAGCHALREWTTGSGMLDQMLRGTVRGQALRGLESMEESPPTASACPALASAGGQGGQLGEFVGGLLRQDNLNTVLGRDPTLRDTLDQDIVIPVMCQRRPVSEAQPALQGLIGRTVTTLVDAPEFGGAVINHLVGQAVQGRMDTLAPTGIGPVDGMIRGMARAFFGRRLDWENNGRCQATPSGRAVVQHLGRKMMLPLVLQQARHPDAANFTCQDITRSMKEAECLVMRAIRCCDIEGRGRACEGRDSLANERRRMGLPALPPGEYCSLSR